MTNATTPNRSNVRSIDTAEAAKMLRKQLAAAFPGTKFSVRTKRYSGGSSIDVTWTDGPTSESVNAIARMFQGKGFDGMIDMEYYIRHWLMPDGTLQIASSPGTVGSRGMHDVIDNPKPHPDAELVSFGTYVSCNRRYSYDFLRKLWAAFSKTHDISDITVYDVYNKWSKQQDFYIRGNGMNGRSTEQWWWQHMQQAQG